uniref:Uncharacterized protein n=1 Tax=Arundo donax TaxID=35708 RepID=A0A0A9A8B0_ARUDO
MTTKHFIVTAMLETPTTSYRKRQKEKGAPRLHIGFSRTCL